MDGFTFTSVVDVACDVRFGNNTTASQPYVRGHTMSPQERTQVTPSLAYELGCAVALVKFAAEHLKTSAEHQALLSRLTPDHKRLLAHFQGANESFKAAADRS